MNTSSEDSLDRLDVLLAESMIRPLDAEEVAEFEQLAGMDGSALLAEAEQAAVTRSSAMPRWMRWNRCPKA